jgi:agmatinase
MSRTPDNFLGLDAETTARARVVVLPVPYEATVSYGSGTANGPRAILTASQQVELYDRDYDREVALEYGVATEAALDFSADTSPSHALDRIAAAVADLARTGRLVVALGGEHAISHSVARGLLAALGGPLTVVQIDAHSDLRDQYDGAPWSHASVARRLLETDGIEQIVQLGIRSVCPEEVAVARANPDRIHLWYREALRQPGWQQALATLVQGRRVFLTLDVDGLDPSIVPATGTPEPDGLTWVEALDILHTVARHAQIIGIDCVELAPAPGLHSADFAVAKLLYKAISAAMLPDPEEVSHG